MPNAGTALLAGEKSGSQDEQVEFAPPRLTTLNVPPQDGAQNPEDIPAAPKLSAEHPPGENSYNPPGPTPS